ncbi:MAG TPA: response regulator transcription factor [Verrucomicrobiae bacterium]|jgi:DNA-binding NarL/FixJ family response regulator
MKKISVLLVDDHQVVRQGLRALLSHAEDIEVVGEAEDGAQAVQMAAKNPPDIIVMDVVMPVVNGLESTKQVLKRVPSTKVLILSSYSDDDYVQKLMDAGAAGYLGKQTAGDDLLVAIREIKKGNTFFSADIARRRRDRRRQAFNDGMPSKKNLELTAREMQVLQLVGNGYANKQVAAELGISIKTVEKHRQQVMNKLNIHEVAGLTRYVVSKGLTKQTNPPS